MTPDVELYASEPNPPESVTLTAPRERALVKYWFVPSDKSDVLFPARSILSEEVFNSCKRPAVRISDFFVAICNSLSV